MDQKLMESKSKYGTLTATQDANGDYQSSNTSATKAPGSMANTTTPSGMTNTTTPSGMTNTTAPSGMTNTTTPGNMTSNTMNQTNMSSKQQNSKSKYGTLTATSDANNDYK